MALRKIKLVGDDILRKQARKVEVVDDRIKLLIDDMLETMYKERGVGLAAPQVGILKQVIVIDIGKGPLALINPVIVSQEGEQLSVEGCLSVPDLNGKVMRPKKVKIEALDTQGKPVTIKAKEFLAIVLSHEIDHLNGILFIDKAIETIRL